MRWLVALIAVAAVSVGGIVVWSATRQRSEPPKPEAARERGDWEVVVVGADGKPAWNITICSRLKGDPQRVRHKVARTDKRGRALIPPPPDGESWTIAVGPLIQVDAVRPHTRVTAKSLVPVEFVILDGESGRRLDARVSPPVAHVWQGTGRRLTDVVVEPPDGYVIPCGSRPVTSVFAERVRAIMVAHRAAPSDTKVPSLLRDPVNRPFMYPRSGDPIGEPVCRCSLVKHWYVLDDGASGDATLTVRIKRGNGRPACKTSVSLLGPRRDWASTDYLGQVEFGALPAGIYKLRVKQPGYAFVEREVVVGDRAHVRMTVEEPACWTATVTVVDESGRPAPFVEISVAVGWPHAPYVHLVDGTQTVGIYTDAAGQAVLPGIGRDTVTVNGYEVSRDHPSIRIPLR